MNKPPSTRYWTIPDAKRVVISERLKRRTDIDGCGGCWIFTGSRWIGGYGSMRVGDRHWPAHRVSYVLNRGPVEVGLCVCHKCDNPPCVNPDHLFLGTDADNAADRMSKGRGAPGRKGEQNPVSKLTKADISEIRRRRDAGETQRSIAAAFGIAQSTVFRIVHRRAWRHI